jgi:photosystem II stability/assembly factor-like uncharacterized protein
MTTPPRPMMRIVLLSAILAASRVAGVSAQQPPPDPFAALHFRAIGPVGNRMSAVVGEPGNPAVVYIGSADGGVWKTEDAGLSWTPTFDHEDVAAIGALAIAPSQHNVVWAGTGETWIIRPYYALGDGVYKSTDAGRTWHHMGLEETGRIPRIVVDEHDPDRVFVCALGQTHRPQHERGVFRTVDGGKTWQQVLFVDENTGCSDLAADPHDPNTLFAGMWQVDIKRWNLNSGGPGSGVYVSHDGGTTWSKVAGHGLPPADRPIGKVAVGIARSDPDRVYALLQEDTPRFYRSNDRGRTWQMVNDLHVIDERAPYYTRFTIAPDDENLIYFPSVSYSISRDGGETVFQPSRRGDDPSGQASPGGDNHDVWIDPTNPRRFMVANDAGVSITLDHGHTFDHIPLPIAQMYHVAVDDEVPYHVLGNKQDGSSYRGPSRSLSGGFGGSAITTSQWTSTGGCEDGFAVPDPTDANIVWSGCDNGKLDRMDLRTGQSREVTVWPDVALGWAPKDVKYRWDWVFPIAIDPLDHNRVYAGSQFVHMTTDGGQSWKVISPDLTRNDKSHQASSGGITADNLTTYDGATLYAIAPSPAKEGVIWAGSDDGEVQVTEDGGAHWTNVTAHIPNLPPWGVVWNITPSKYAAGSAYVAINLQNSGDYTPYVYKTSDFGATWTFIGGGVPKSVNSSPHCIIEDPERKGMLYLGTDNGVYVSWDDGSHWTRLRSNLPPAPVYWMVLQPRFGDLVIATHGRGFFILDDVAPLREYQEAQAQPAHLFKPRAAYRFRRVDAGRQNDAGSRVIGENPPYGADLNFWLKSPVDHVELSFVDAHGDVVRTMTVHGRAGLNRVWWDLRYESAKAPDLLTSLPGEPWVRAGRHLAGYGFRVPEAGPVVPPGAYTVRLAAGASHLTAPLQVEPDPHTLGTAQSIGAQVRFILEVRAELNEVADMVNRLEQLRKQVEDSQILLEHGAGDRAAALKESRDYDQTAIALEARMIDVHNTGRGEDAFREPVQLYEKLSWLITRINGNPGSGPGGADMAPTTQQIAVNAQFKEEIARLQEELKRFLAARRPTL